MVVMAGPVVVSGEVELREIIGRALFRSAFRLRDWETAKPYLKKVMYARADEAIRRAGVENVSVPVSVQKFGKIENRKER